MKKIYLLLFLSSLYNLLADSVEIGLGKVEFDYSEYLDNGSWYNSEISDNMDLDGGFIKYNYNLIPVEDGELKYDQNLEFKYSFHLNKALHKQPNTVDTPTKNYLHQLHARYHAVNKMDTYDIGIFLGLGYRYWDRDMLGGNGLTGYLETYQWPYYEAGLSWRWYEGDYFTGFEASYQEAYKPKMKAYVYGGLDFDLGKTKGYKLLIPFGYKINKNYTITYRYVTDVWEIGKSNTVRTNSVTAYEPRSETKNQYNYLSIEYKF